MKTRTIARASLTSPQNPGLAREALSEVDGDDRRRDHDRDDDVHLGQMLAEADVPVDPEGERVLSAGRERRYDDLVEREREREQRARDERGREDRQRDEAERLPA